jgi:hypothetical protein
MPASSVGKQWTTQLSRALDDLKVFIPSPIQAIVIKLVAPRRGTTALAGPQRNELTHLLLVLLVLLC